MYYGLICALGVSNCQIKTLPYNDHSPGVPFSVVPIEADAPGGGGGEGVKVGLVIKGEWQVWGALVIVGNNARRQGRAL